MPDTVIGVVSDLFFTVKIEDVARSLGYTVIWARPEDRFADLLVQHQPALIIVDISDQTLPWQEWILRAKVDPATRRIPVLGFGSHVDVATRDRALALGFDEVLPRSRFVAELPELIARHARVMRSDERALLAQQCAEPLPPPAVQGLEQFNRGAYFEAHETLEHAWQAETGPVRDLYRAVLQIAVAYHHVTRRNYAGALKMFRRSRQWFNRLPPDTCQGIDLARLRADAERVEAAVRALGPERIGEIDLTLLKPVNYERR
jgi:CheY-like chemotaxis protein